MGEWASPREGAHQRGQMPCQRGGNVGWPHASVQNCSRAVQNACETARQRGKAQRQRGGNVRQRGGTALWMLTSVQKACERGEWAVDVC